MLDGLHVTTRHLQLSETTRLQLTIHLIIFSNNQFVSFTIFHSLRWRIQVVLSDQQLIISASEAVLPLKLDNKRKRVKSHGYVEGRLFIQPGVSSDASLCLWVLHCLLFRQHEGEWLTAVTRRSHHTHSQHTYTPVSLHSHIRTPAKSNCHPALIPSVLRDFVAPDGTKSPRRSKMIRYFDFKSN